MKKVQLSDDLVTKILSLYESGANLNQIKDTVGISRKLVKRCLLDHGKDIKTKSEIIRDKIPTLNDRDEMYRLYYTENLSIDEVAEKLGTNSQIIKNTLNRLRIPIMDIALKRMPRSELRSLDFMYTEYCINLRSVNSIANELGVSSSAVESSLDFFKIKRRNLEEQIAVMPRDPKKQLSAKISRNLRSRLSIALRNGQKKGSAVEDLGCSIEELKAHLENQFTDGMSWDNYGDWEIDHVTPLSSYNLQDKAQLLKACHYTNLQPLFKSANRKKSDSIILQNKVPLFIVCGPSGSGKTYVCESVPDVVYIAYDKYSKESHLYHMVEAAKAGIPILYDPLRKPITFYNKYKNTFDIKVLVISEDYPTIYNRILLRGGKPNKEHIIEAMKRVERWKKSAHFSGTSDEVLAFLRQELEKIKR